MGIIIREDVDKYMSEMKQCIADGADWGLEEMSDFFSQRVEGYEEHMAIWKEAYIKFAYLLSKDNMKVLDLGCGTGLELDEIWKLYPHTDVTGIDMCEAMLNKLKAKHNDKALNIICDDYLKHDIGLNTWDAVISFESLHHFIPETKTALYKKIYNSLSKDGAFIIGDYIACCDEEEQLLQKVLVEKRKKFNIPDDEFVHFDIPLTLDHEIEIIKSAGFKDVSAPYSINGATMIYAVK